MKTLSVCILFALFCLQANSQATRKTITQSKTTTTKSSTTGKTPNAATSQQVKSRNPVAPGRTSTSTNSAKAAPTESTSTPKSESPFVGGIHPAKDAAKTFDTLNAATGATSNASAQAGITTTSVVGTDTIHNVNTTIENGVSTNSGAVDKSGQSQFGQTNWGRNSRNTVGESQWTVPPPVTTAFRRDFPDAASTTWRKNLTDSSLYFARYRSGANWAYTTYNANGERVSTHIEIPLVQAPRSVSVYLAKQPDDVRLTSISRLQMEGKPEVYEIKTSNGKTIYINNDGVETTLK